MAQGKPAGVRCIQLADGALPHFGQPERSAGCGGGVPALEMCGASKEQTLMYVAQLGAVDAVRNATRLDSAMLRAGVAMAQGDKPPRHFTERSRRSVSSSGLPP